MADRISKNLGDEELSWKSLDGSKRNAVKLRTVHIGRGTYLPGWKWSEHEGKKEKEKTAEAHIGYIVAGSMAVQGKDNVIVHLVPGDAFEVAAGHDAWVEGDESCVALDFELLDA